MNVTFDQKRNNVAELVEIDAKNIADELGGGDDATKTQVRKFYQEYLSILNNIKSDSDKNYAFSRNKVKIKMLIPKGEYSKSRNPNITGFISWLNDNLQNINTAEDAIIFGDYFEAFVGYFYAAIAQ